MRKSLIRTLISCIWTLISVAATPVYAATPAIELFGQVQSLKAAMRYDQAEALLEASFLGSAAEPISNRISILELLAEVQILASKYSDAGDTRWNIAQLLARLEGSDSPALSTVYEASGDAYRMSGESERAIAAYEAALGIDRMYLDCESEALARLYQRLAKHYAETGNNRKSSQYLSLSNDQDLRCSFSGGSRQAIVTGGESETDGEFARVKVYYGTDRARTGSDRPQGFYGAQRGTIEYGRVNVSIPRNHKAGRVEAPSLLRFEWRENPSRHIVLLDIEQLSKDEFFEDIRSSLVSGGKDGLFVFIHGYNVDFADAAKRTAQLTYDLNFEGAPVFYSWPARGTTMAYLSDSAVIQLSARHLTYFLEDIVERSGARQVHLIAHSMGNRALIEALELLALRQNNPEAEPVFEQIIFAAPDVDAGLFSFVADNIEHLARRMTLYTSNADLALQASRKLHGDAPRAGQGGDSILVASGVDSVDMTEVGEDMMGHNYFASGTSALTDILWLFWRDQPPGSRCGMLKKTGDAGEYWFYSPQDCNSSIVLSALTLARQEGRAALTSTRLMIEKLRANGSSASAMQRDLQEWTQIRQVLTEIFSR